MLSVIIVPTVFAPVCIYFQLIQMLSFYFLWFPFDMSMILSFEQNQTKLKQIKNILQFNS